MAVKKMLLAAVAASSIASAALAADFDVYAAANSTSGGVGASTIALSAGQSFSVTVDPNDFWSAGALPRWSNADGLVGNVFYAAGMDPEITGVAVGTQIGGNFGLPGMFGLTAPYGSLVGQIGSGSLFVVGTHYSGVASASGTLKLYYFDSNSGDNFGHITAHVAAVPEPETYAMFLAGLGLLGALGRRRQH